MTGNAGLVGIITPNYRSERAGELAKIILHSQQQYK
jgi:hypothetical protein